MAYADTPTPRTRPAIRRRAADTGGWSRMQIGWPVVALVTVMLGAIVAILTLVPPGDQRGQTIITIMASALASLLAALFVARRAENAVQPGQPEPEPEPEPEQPPITYRPYQPPGSDRP